MNLTQVRNQLRPLREVRNNMLDKIPKAFDMVKDDVSSRKFESSRATTLRQV